MEDFLQCGGQGWTGPTACPSGWACTVSNQYYSQCLQGAASASTVVPVSVPSSAPAGGPSATSSVPASATPTLIAGESFIRAVVRSLQESLQNNTDELTVLI